MRREVEDGGGEPGEPHRLTRRPPHREPTGLEPHVRRVEVLELGADVEIDVVELDLAQSQERQVGQRCGRSTAASAGAVPLGRGPRLLETTSRRPEVVDHRSGAPAPSGGDPAVTLLRPAGVLVGDVTDRRGVEDAAMTVRVAGEVGDQLGAAPPVETGRAIDRESAGAPVGSGRQDVVESSEQAAVGTSTHLDVAHGLVDGGHERRLVVARSWHAGRMQLGMIGLGRMGANMARRLKGGGHDCVVYDVSDDAVSALEDEGFTGAHSLEDFVSSLEAPRSVWVMIPAAFVGDMLDQLVPLLDEDDTVIDGGNSWYHLDVDRAKKYADDGIHYVDVGTSGGVAGLERGYCLMIGGDDTAVGRLEPVFDTLAPGVESAERTPGRTGDIAPEERGWLHCGPSGAGHFVKMVHNGIEYGIMSALGEGLNVLHKADIGLHEHDKDAETAPLDSADYYQFDIDLPAVTEVWRRGSVITSWLLDLTAEAYQRDANLDAFSGHVSDSGEGRWTIAAAIDEGVPVPVLSAALFQRFSSRGRDDMANKALSAMRAGFGGHKERKGSTR